MKRFIKLTPKQVEPFVAISVALFLAAIFISAYRHFIAPYYPRHWDQLTFLTEAYRYFFFFTHGLDYTSQGSLLIEPRSLCSFKGCIRETLTFVAQLLFGPNRVSIALTNLCFLWVGLSALYFSLRRVSGISSATFGIGIALLASTIYLPPGGLVDLRWDFAGTMAFGVCLF